MTKEPTIETLWDSAAGFDANSQTCQPSEFGPGVRRYLDHAIVPGTPCALAVRLHMHGEIKLKRWLPFTAEQVINWQRGFIWNACTRINGMPVSGFDRLVDAHGVMRWKLFGLIPVMAARGPDISRSAAGRMIAESAWLPSMLCAPQVSWSESDPNRLHACVTVFGETATLDIVTDNEGRIKKLSLLRWGNPGGAGFSYVPFSGFADEERTFSGYTIPSRLRSGYYVDSDRFNTDGEFIRIVIDDAHYR